MLFSPLFLHCLLLLIKPFLLNLFHGDLFEHLFSVIVNVKEVLKLEPAQCITVVEVRSREYGYVYHCLSSSIHCLLDLRISKISMEFIFFILFDKAALSLFVFFSLNLTIHILCFLYLMLD